MFDSHIRFFAYDNVEGDDFGVGYLGNKEWWVSIINRWNLNDGNELQYTPEEWEDLSIDDFRGLKIAEVVPDGDGYLVTWTDGTNDNVIEIDKNSKYNWVENNTQSTSVPRWVSRLKNMIKEANLQ